MPIIKKLQQELAKQRRTSVVPEGKGTQLGDRQGRGGGGGVLLAKLK